LKENPMSKIGATTNSKVPEVTLGFWIIKIAATTLGETGGDAVSMSLNLGYAVSSTIFIGLFALAVVAQIAAKSFHPFLYWLVIIATTTAGTTMADFADRSLGIGYAGGSAILFVLLMAALGIWYRSAGTVSFTPSILHGSRRSTGSPSCFRKPWERRSATGWPTPAWATKAARWFSPPG
jgi:uncharacterized membrane-anchored protein